MGHIMQKVLGNKGQIMYFLINASPPKPLHVATSNFAGAYRLHDVEGIGQHFV